MHRPTLPARWWEQAPERCRNITWEGNSILPAAPSSHPYPPFHPLLWLLGPPASPPPASESSRPAWDLPAKNKPGWGQEGGSKIPSVVSLSPTAWLLGVLNHHRGDAHPCCASVSTPRGNHPLGWAGSHGLEAMIT